MTNINIKLPSTKQLKYWGLGLLLITNAIQFIPAFSTYLKYNVTLNHSELTQVHLTMKHFLKHESDVISKNTYKTITFPGDTNSKIKVRIYPGNDIYINVMTIDGGEHPYWVPSQKSLDEIKKEIPTAVDLFKKIIEITNVFAATPQQQRAVPFDMKYTEIALGWIKVGVIAKFQRTYSNGQVWIYFFNYRTHRTYGWKRIK